MKANYEDEEDAISGEFKKVPIDYSQSSGVEVYNMYSSSYSKDRLKKKIIKYSLIILAIIAFVFITKRYLLDGIIQIFSEDDVYNDNINSYLNGSFADGNSVDNPVEHFFINQNMSNMDMKLFSSPQLRNPKNIKLINKLDVTLCIEFDKFVHMKIKDAENPRWEIPRKDILNKDYVKEVDENKISLSLYSKYLDSRTFYIEFLSNKFIEQQDFDRFRDFDIAREEKYDQMDEFSFRLMTSEEEQFYLFNSSKNFIYSDNYINFQSELTSDNIFGFGERTHEFKLGEGLYTI